jgi:hypothetical protein
MYFSTFPELLYDAISLKMLKTHHMSIKLYVDLSLSIMMLNYKYGNLDFLNYLLDGFNERLHPEDFYLSQIAIQLVPSIIRKNFKLRRQIGLKMHVLLALVQTRTLPLELCRMVKFFLI